MAIIGLVVIAAYVPSLSVPFQFDDYARILENVGLQSGDLLTGVQFLGNSRLIPSTSIALNYWLAGGETLSYHVVNLAVHLLATLAVFQLALALCRTPRVRDTWLAEQSLALAAGAALLFACHPIQTQAVTYIIQRSASTATMFYVWSVVLFVNGRNRRVEGDHRGVRARYVACAALAACAVLSKENAASLPVVLLLTEWVFYGERGRRRRLLRLALLALFVLAIPVGWKVLTWTARGPGGGSMTWLEQAAQAVFAQGAAPSQVNAPLDYFRTQLVVLPGYLRLIVLPWGLNVDHDVPMERELSAAVLGGFALLAGLALLGLYAARRWPLVGFGVLWFFIAMSVESSFLPLVDVMMEHRVYLGMPGIALVFGSLFAWVSHRRPAVALSVGVPVVVILLALTFARNQVWQTPLSLWSDAVARSPGKARVHVNVGVAYHGLEQLDDAIRHYCKALEINPKIAVARDNLEIALDQQGRLDEVIARVVAKPPNIPGAPAGAVILEFDAAAVACPPAE